VYGLVIGVPVPLMVIAPSPLPTTEQLQPVLLHPLQAMVVV
jgi:hypothetical protein